MPTYDYKCDACGHEFEQFQNFSDEVLTKCPKCKKKKLRRLIGAGAAVVFKGSGFYTTDYRSDSYKKAASADKPAESSSDSKSSESSEKKPAAKSEPKSEAKSESKPAKPSKGKSSGGE